MALTFYWRCENSATLDWNGSTGADYSSADTTGTSSGTAPSFSNTIYKVGAYSMNVTSAGRYSFAGTNITSAAAGSIAFWFRRSGTVTTDIEVFSLRGTTSTDLISIRSVGNCANFRLYFRSSSPATAFQDTATDSASMTTDTWYFVVAKWNDAANASAIYIYDASGNLLDSDSRTTGWDAPLGTLEVRIGDNSGSLTNVFYDNIFIGDSYDDADTFLTKRDITSYTEYAASAPAITSTDPTLYNGQVGVTISGTGFGMGGGSSAILISPTDDVDDASAVTQTETGSRSDTTATFTAVRGSLAYNTTMYLFVKDSTGASNASGYAVVFYDLADGLAVFQRRATFVNEIIIQH